MVSCPRAQQGFLTDSSQVAIDCLADILVLDLCSSPTLARSKYS
jgi:hypothetical protein